MAGQIEIGGRHHVRLTVTDIRRSRAFYSFEICVLPFRDPDNVQLELTSPL